MISAAEECCIHKREIAVGVERKQLRTDVAWSELWVAACNGPTLITILITLNNFSYKLIKFGPAFQSSIFFHFISNQLFLHIYISYHCRLNRQNGLGMNFDYS